MRNIYKCRVCGAYTEEKEHCGEPTEMVLDGAKRVRLSKLMSALLRHIPHEAGLQLDREGWVGVDELVEAIRTKWRNRDAYQWVRREDVLAVALLDPKGRFQLSHDMKKIRASYGHSVRVDVGYQPLGVNELPRVLYHGTIRERLESILEKGLLPMKRLKVHLTVDENTALEVAKRHGKNVVILVIDAECVRRRGFNIYKASDVVYLADYVPPQCIKVRKSYPTT